VVEHFTQNTKSKGSNPATSTGREKMVKKVFLGLVDKLSTGVQYYASLKLIREQQSSIFAASVSDKETSLRN
jgi:hypothetical protein